MGPQTKHFYVEGPGGLNVVKQAGGYLSNLPIWAPVLDNGGVSFNVKALQYGAYGNGVSDDTLAFNAAMTAATAVNGTVMIPTGTYILNPTNLNNITCNLIGSSMDGVILKIVGGYNATNDFIRIVSQNGLVIGNFTIDGNKSAQGSGTNYGLYLSTCTNSKVYNVTAQNLTGVGIHFYNNNRCEGDSLWATANAYHGFEFEQNSRCKISNLNGYSNTLHGVLVDPGEVGGTGSHGNVFTNLQCNFNGNYGLAFNAANGDVSAWLSEGDSFENVTCMGNTFYGLNIYKQDKQQFNNVYITGNGYFGIYLFESQYNTFSNVFCHNNSQASAGSYDEIYQEGYSSNNSHPSLGNIFNGGQILINGTTKARYGFNEGTASDGPNTFVNINIPSAGTAGTINQLCPSDLISMPGGVVQIGNFGQSIQGALAGFDSAFTNVLRLYNNFPGGSTQVVAPNGNIQLWAGGSNSLNINKGGMVINYQNQQGINSTATASAAQVAAGYITSTSAAATTITLPTATAIATAIGAARGTVFDLYIDNTLGANTVTITPDASMTKSQVAQVATYGVPTFGLFTVANGTSGIGCFRMVFASATACTIARVF